LKLARTAAVVGAAALLAPATALSLTSAQSAAAGAKAGKAAGKKVKVPKITVGYLQIVGAVESAQRAERNVKQAASLLGWKFVRCDAQGVPAQMAKCGDTLLDQNVDVIIQTGIEPSLINAQLKKAKKLGVPVFEHSGLVSATPLFAGAYYPDEPRAGKVLAQELIKRLNSAGGGEIAVHDYPAPWASKRTDELEKLLVGDAKNKIAVTVQTDAANLVAGTQKTVSDQLTSNSKLKAFWFAFDSAGQAGGGVIQQKFSGKSFPDKPLVATFHADLATSDLIRSGAVDFVVDVPYELGGWIAVDQAAELFARKRAPSKQVRPSYPGMGTGYDYVIVDKNNVPAKGKYRKPPVDFVSYFKAKCATEFRK
jgi:ABC-type sugar transport system substrate-binding protein